MLYVVRVITAEWGCISEGKLVDISFYSPVGTNQIQLINFSVLK